MIRFILIAGLLIVSSTGCARQRDSTYKNDTPADVEALIKQDTTAIVLDVRTQTEFESESGHLNKATLIPLQELEQRLGEIEKYKDRMIVVYCRSGVRSARAAGLLKAKGFHVENMLGGILRWNAEHRPVERVAHPQ